jgi:predicted dehydrogenase
MPDIELVAICDLIHARAQRLAQTYAIPKVYPVYHEMLRHEAIDALFVLVEPANLYHIVWHSLEAGCDVFMEKPPGITLFQAESLARQAADTQRFLQVGFNRRFIPLVREVKKIMETRTHINQIEATFFKFGSAVFDRGSLNAFVSDTIHGIDLVRWIAGGEPQVAALVAAQNDDLVLSAWNGICQFDNGVTGIIKANYRTGGRVHRVEIHGPGLSAYVDLGFGGAASQAVLLSHAGEIQYSLAARGAANEGIETIDGLKLAGSSEFYRYYGFYFEDRHFIDCVRTRTEPESSIADAVKTMALVELLMASRLKTR